MIVQLDLEDSLAIALYIYIYIFDSIHGSIIINFSGYY